MIQGEEEEGEEGDGGSRRKRLCLEWQVLSLVSRSWLLFLDWCFGCGGYGRWCLGRLYFGWQKDVVLPLNLDGGGGGALDLV